MWISIQDPDYAFNMPLYEGEAQIAHEYLIPGQYNGVDENDAPVAVFISTVHTAVDWQ